VLRAKDAKQGLEDEVADRRRNATRQKAEIRELSRSNMELEQFAYIASHDLQEPLRKIRAFGDTVKRRYETVLDERGKDYLQRMQNAAERMQDLINALLSLSRVTTKAKPPEFTSIKQVIESVLSDMETAVSLEGASVDVIGDLPTIEADPMQMRQLFQNLISNALKFRRGEVSPAISILAEEVIDPGVPSSEPQYRLRVQDNGLGFDDKYRERIFAPFERLHSRNEIKGTGIGLAICRKIVERHGGTIEAESAVGQGATFIVTLPKYQRGMNQNTETA
jgi:light-regulated signal transduction histidine kinase (bacteriophytochrome)